MTSVRGLRRLALALGLFACGPAAAAHAPDAPPTPEQLGATARRWSLAATAVPVAAGAAWALAVGTDDVGPGVALASAGILLGPAAGYLRAGEPGRGLAGIGMRTLVVAGTGAAALGTVIAYHGSGGEDELGAGEGVLAAVLAAGALAVTGSAVWDVAVAGRVVRTRAAGRGTARGAASFGVAPGGRGLAVQWRF